MAQAAFHGNIGKVRGLQFSNDGKPRFSFSVGESHSRFDKQANEWKKTGTTWRNVTVFGKRAEALAETIQEGAKQQVVVIGREETREYEKDGQTGYSFDVIADIVGVVPQAQQGSHQQPSAPAANSWNAPAEDPWSSSTGGGWGNETSGGPAF